VIDELNEQLTPEQQLKTSNNTVLFGKLGKLDSLGLVNLIVMIEQNIEDEFDIAVTLADEKSMSQKHSPFRTVGHLADYIETLLDEELND